MEAANKNAALLKENNLLRSQVSLLEKEVHSHATYNQPLQSNTLPSTSFPKSLFSPIPTHHAFSELSAQ